MKINAYLENCRQAICDAIKQTENELDGKPTNNGYTVRRELVFALHELDAFRHGTLQNCESKCGYEETLKGP